ncbi:MAG: hypothetical protein ACK50J_10765, partial [Planctomyces sp.]
MTEDLYFRTRDSGCRHLTTVTCRSWPLAASPEKPFRGDRPLKARRIETVLRRIARGSEGTDSRNALFRNAVIKKALSSCPEDHAENARTESSDPWKEMTHRAIDPRRNHAIRR